MLWTLLPLVFIPIGILGVLKLLGKGDFTIPEYLMALVISVLVVVAGFFVARAAGITDTEKFGGRIASKDHGSMKCCHCHEECDTCYRTVTDSQGRSSQESYSCNCREVCDHPRDYYWSLDVDTGLSHRTLEIDTCEPNKHHVPQAWTDAYVGEPASIPHKYPNYLLADDQTVHRQSVASEIERGVPGYPGIYGHYKANQALNDGTLMPMDEWNMGLRELNAELGNAKQVNVIVIATLEQDPTYRDKVESEWLYGKKNDLIFVLGVDPVDKDTITWAGVVTISYVEELKIEARDGMPGMKLSDHEATLAYIEDLVMRKFERVSMGEEFGYLMANAKPKGWHLAALYAVDIILAIILGIVAIKYDVFGGMTPRRGHRVHYNRRRRRFGRF